MLRVLLAYTILRVFQQLRDRKDGSLPTVFRGFAQNVEFGQRFGGDAFVPQVFFEDGNVAAQLIHAALLNCNQMFADFFNVDAGLCGFGRCSGCEIDKLEVLSRNTESLDVGTWKAQVNVFTISTRSRDDIDGIRGAKSHPVARLGRWWLGHRSLVESFGQFIRVPVSAIGVRALGRL